MLAPSGTRLQAQDELQPHSFGQIDCSRFRLRVGLQSREVAWWPRDACPITGATQNSPLPRACSDGARIAALSARRDPDDTDAALDREIKPSHGRSWPDQA
jgi:hypothetical protein